jgi:hypothetical protein
MLEKQIRDLKTQIEDITEELENERALRMKAEQKRNELVREHEQAKRKMQEEVS